MNRRGWQPQWMWLGVLAISLHQGVVAAPLPPEIFAQLSAQEFRRREVAEADLLAWSRTKPEAAKDELLKQSRFAADPESRVRCLNVLKTLVFDDYAKEGEGYIGITMRDDKLLVPGDRKMRSVIRVMATMPNTGAAMAGILPNEIIVGLGGKVWYDVAATEQFMNRIRSMKPEMKVELKILRAGKIVDVTVVLGRRPVVADQPQFGGGLADIQAAERASKEEYFRRWLENRAPK